MVDLGPAFNLLGMDTSAPVWNLTVNNTDITESIARYVREVEFESSDSMADMLSIRLVNPDNHVTDSKIFQPGNEVSVFAGYGTQVGHLGRALIVRATPMFPQEGEPTVTIEGYSKDCLMMDNEPEPKPKNPGAPPPAKKGAKKVPAPAQVEGRAFATASYKDIVETVASRKAYGFQLDVDDPNYLEKDLVQKVGMSDYALIRGLANTVGFEFWVDADEKGVWTLHFKNPKSMKVQDKTYRFTYNYMDDSTLLSFQPELLVKGGRTKISVKVKDVKSGRILAAEFEEPGGTSPDMNAMGGLMEPITGEYTSAADIALQFGGFAFDVVTNRRFTVEAEVTAWAEQWFRRMREKFILSQGTVIGIPDLRAFQKHYLDNIGVGYSGQYQFSKVKHILSDSNGYICTFGARKVVSS